MENFNVSLIIFKIILVFVFNNLSNAQPTSGWFYQQSPVSTGFNDVKFSDVNNGIIVGANGTILKTTTSGDNWILVNSGTNKNLKSISISSPSQIYISGDSGTILKSVDAGNSWSSLNIAAAHNLNSIVFKNNIGFAGGSNGTLLRTTNNGLNWNSTFSDNSVTFNSISFVNESLIWVAGQRDSVYVLGYMIKTTNLGLNWVVVTPKLSDFYVGYSIVFLDSLNGFCGFCSTPLDYGVLRTIDGGLNWECVDGAINCCPNSIHFINIMTGFSIGEGIHPIYKTTNGGSWIVSPAPFFFESLNSSYFVNSLTGWAVGWKILKTITGGGILTNVIKTSENVPFEFSLHQNYPNPFNPSTKIKFDIPKSSAVKLIVYNSLGERVETLIDDALHKGSFELTFDGSNYASGIYFYKLETNGYTFSKKMLLLK